MSKSKKGIMIILSLLSALTLTLTFLNFQSAQNSKKLLKLTSSIKENLPTSSNASIKNPCSKLIDKNFENCLSKFLVESKDTTSSGYLLGYYLVTSPQNDAYKISKIRELFKDPRIQNKCYDLFLTAGHYTYSVLGERALKYDITLCRSMFKVGMYQAMKGKYSHDILLKRISTLCDLDPEKNGCADGVGRLVYDYGYTFADASRACAHGETVSAKNETFYEGCMGGYGNWSRYGSFFRQYTSIQDVRIKLCKNIDRRGLSTCMGYGMRSYVRSGLTIGNYQARLDEYYKACILNPQADIKDTCGQYLGFTLADIFNDRTGLGEPLAGKELAQKIDYYCLQNGDCLSSFIAWYINQWAFSNDGKLNISGSNLVCHSLMVANKENCLNMVTSEIDRYNKRIVKAAQE